MALSKNELLGDWLLVRYANRGESIHHSKSPQLFRFFPDGLFLMEEPTVNKNFLRFSYEVTENGFRIEPRPGYGWEILVTTESDGTLLLTAPNGRRDWIKRKDNP